MIARIVLLTGTGTVGREVLLALLRHTHDDVAILIRDRRTRTAMQRADALFRELELTEEERARVQILPGDITRAGLGLDAVTQERVVERVDVIVHTAAVTSLTADRLLCDTVNCGGTANVLLLAARCFASGRLQRFLHVSTALVAGSGSAGLAREDELPVAATHTNHYEWSKYEGERLVRAAMRAGLPVTVFRPSMVVGDTNTGCTRDFNVIYPLMRLIASGYVTRFPADPAARVHLAPRDFVVGAITRALEAPWTTGMTFHLTAPEPPTVSQLFDCEAFFPSSATRPRLCAPRDFDLAACEPRERAMLESVSFCFPYFNSHLSFDTSNTRRLVPLPVTDDAYLERLGRYAVDTGYIRHRVS